MRQTTPGTIPDPLTPEQRKLLESGLDNFSDDLANNIYGQRFDKGWLRDTCKTHCAILYAEIDRLKSVIQATQEDWEKAWAEKCQTK